MKDIIRVVIILLAVVVVVITASCSFGGNKYEITANEFKYQDISVPNPMKGFVSLYEHPTEDSSMEYIGLKFSDVYNHDGTEGSINEAHIDAVLGSVAARGHSLIMRVYILYPGYNDGESTGLYLPDSIYSELKANGDIHSNIYNGHKLEYPDFNSPELIAYMTDFIKKLGERYDGHPALAAIQLGLYGSWGEWNMSCCNTQRCAMTEENMGKLLDAYTNAFHTTKLMARNPSLGKAYSYDVGFHDDNFLFNSSDFHSKSIEWKTLLSKLDPAYVNIQQFYDFMNGCNGKYEPIWDRWETQMFGGELSGMMYDDCFGSIFEGVEREALDYSINQFHMSWLMGVGNGGIPDKETSEYKEYLEVANSFGYNIGIVGVQSKNRTGKVTVSLTNYGIAPFYYDWDIEYSLLDEDGKMVYVCCDESFKLSDILPETTLESTFIMPEKIKQGTYTLCMRVVNPAEEISPNVMPVKLANNNMVENGVYEIASIIVK